MPGEFLNVVMEEDGGKLDSSVKNEEVFHKVKEDRSILHTIKSRKANWICHVLSENWLLKHVNEGKIQGRIEVTRRRGRRGKGC